MVIFLVLRWRTVGSVRTRKVDTVIERDDSSQF